MKLFIAGLAIAVAASSPAFAQAKSKQARDKVEPKSWEANWQRQQPRSPNPQWDVYRGNGEYAGTDPDPHVRLMLRRDQPNGD